MSGALATAGGITYGTLEGYAKAVESKTGKELFKFKTPSGIIGNFMSYSLKVSNMLVSYQVLVDGLVLV